MKRNLAPGGFLRRARYTAQRRRTLPSCKTNTRKKRRKKERKKNQFEAHGLKKEKERNKKRHKAVVVVLVVGCPPSFLPSPPGGQWPGHLLLSFLYRHPLSSYYSPLRGKEKKEAEEKTSLQLAPDDLSCEDLFFSSLTQKSFFF